MKTSVDVKLKEYNLELLEKDYDRISICIENTKKLNQIIKQNRLTDFEPVRLVNSVKKIELSS